MKKIDEIIDTKSCLNKAADDEPIFVLLGRDVAAPSTVRSWCRQRVESGKNSPNDEQILEALVLAEKMERYRNARK